MIRKLHAKQRQALFPAFPFNPSKNKKVKEDPSQPLYHHYRWFQSRNFDQRSLPRIRTKCYALPEYNERIPRKGIKKLIGQIVPLYPADTPRDQRRGTRPHLTKSRSTAPDSSHPDAWHVESGRESDGKPAFPADHFPGPDLRGPSASQRVKINYLIKRLITWLIQPDGVPCSITRGEIMVIGLIRV